MRGKGGYFVRLEVQSQSPLAFASSNECSFRLGIAFVGVLPAAAVLSELFHDVSNRDIRVSVLVSLMENLDHMGLLRGERVAMAAFRYGTIVYKMSKAFSFCTYRFVGLALFATSPIDLEPETWYQGIT